MTQALKRRYFGTDGIRGTVGQSPIAPEFMLRLGWAAGRVLAHQKDEPGSVVIGKDTRISGYMFESALQAGLSSAGVNILLLGPMPTPAIAYLTRTLHAQAGIVISASHNPYYDNGIKFFSSEGTKLGDDVELAIEQKLTEPVETVESARLGKARRIDDAAGRYIEFCKSTIPGMTALEGMNIVVDCAHGATYHVAPSVFSELGAKVTAIGVQPDGLNINEACGSTHPQRLQQTVLETGADVGVALDGDGDRVIMVNACGDIVDGDELLYVIAKSRVNTAAADSAVVGTLMTNLGLEIALKAMGIELYRAKVGDRYVMELLTSNGCKLGGEGSGHIICLDKTTTGDGIVAALQVLAYMVDTGRGLHELTAGMEKLPQVLINVRTDEPFDYRDSEAVTRAVREVEHELGEAGRVLLRASGTEPVIRVMVEGREAETVRRLAEQLARHVREAYERR